MLINREKEKFQILSYQLKLREIENVFEKLEKNHITPVLIKGAAAAAYYPKPFWRAFSDIDLAVSPVQFEEASKYIKQDNLNVDLHNGLRHLDVLEWEDLFSNSRILKINNTNVRVLRREDHLRVVCVHWLNDGGEDRTRLWDIYFTINKDAQSFDWNRFYGAVSEKRKYWLATAILAAEEYLGLEISKNHFEDQNYKLHGWVKRELEKEWKNDERLTPLDQILDNRTMFWKQLKKRVPPNYLQSIVDTDSEITSKKKINIVIKDFFIRSKPSIKRILKKTINRGKEKI